MSPRTSLATLVAVALLAFVGACGKSVDEGRATELLATSAGCGQPPPAPDAAGQVVATIPSSGGERSYLVVIPPGYSPDVAAPVAFMFHGAGSNKEQQLEYSQFGPVAAAGGGLLVMPDALGRPAFWAPFPGTPRLEGVQDLVFFDDLLRRIGQDFCIDPRRVLVSGMSSGGFMAAAVGCQRSGRVTTVGAVAATMWVAERCDEADPVVYANFHGTDDEVVPYDGSLGSGAVSTGPVEESATGWAAQNGCDSEPTDEPIGTEVVRRTWSGCDSSTALYIVQGGGHTWPGAALEGEGVGLTTHDVDASQIIWDTFEATWP